ncbi:MAG: flagellar M-ring protein [Paracoccaceae bacterium]|nr:MAG: flagellar M-ring protein [Paracoccaceae bacterium]
MERLISTWQALEPRRRLVLVLGATALVAVLVWLARIAATPSLALLYAGLEPQAAAEVVAALEARGVPFELRGQAIYVPAAERDRLRLDLAAQNLPAPGPAGYELLDSLSGFGTTAEMFDATYWRAKEGELARTLLATPGVKAARVHIANPLRRPFQRGITPSASVILTGTAGPIDPARAEAARYLVASAVAGLSPEQVTVIDSLAGIVLRAGEGGPTAAPSPVASDRAEALRGRLERLLAARVGPGRAVVEVSVETVMESETITERVIDPDSRVAIATDSAEKSESAEGTNAPGLTVASNLPDAANTGADTPSKRQSSETRERTNFEVSEVRRERVKMPGDIRRISVAVLVDGIETTAPDGSVQRVPRPAEELAQLEALVKSAVGFDEARGDVVTVTSLAFTQPPELGTAAAPGLTDRLGLDPMTLIQLGVLAAVALALGFFVLRPLLAPPRQEIVTEGGEDAPEAGLLTPPETLESSLEAARSVVAPETADTLPRMALLREVISDRPEEATAVLRAWLEGDVPEEEAA